MARNPSVKAGRFLVNLWAHCCAPLLALILCAGCASAGAANGTVIEEDWATVSLSGAKIGYVHSVTEKIDGPSPVIVTSVFNETRIQRFGMKISFRTDVQFSENAEGQLVETSMKMSGAGMEMDSRAFLTAEKAVVTAVKAGKSETREYPLEEPVLGPYAESLRLMESGFAPGTKVSFKTFVPDQQRVATSVVEFQGKETIEINGVPMDLHKAIIQQDILPGVPIHAWIDDKGSMVRSVVNVMGTMETVRTTREEALRAVSLESIADIADAFNVRTNARFPDSKKVTHALYHIKAKTGDLAAVNFQDRRQNIVERGADWVTLRVDAFPEAAADLAQPGEEYLRPSLYLQSDDPKIIQAASKAAKGVESDLEKAKALERWTYDNISKKTYGVGFDSAKEVLLSKEGDCTEHAVLLAALLRAAGIPSRVVVGITYWRSGFMYHMWTEAFLRDGWTTLDATIGGDFVDATHIALAASPLDSPSATEPFLSLVNVVGNISIEVEEWNTLPLGG